MRRKAIVIALVGAAVVASASPTSAAVRRPPLVRVVDTSRWSPPSPDPMGLAYNSTTGRLLVTDSEVEEMSIWANVSFFETRLDGTIEVKTNLTGFTTEPTDIAFNPGNGHYYLSDDVSYKIFDVTPGSDGKIGTSDDTRTSFDAKVYNDPEGLSYGANSLFVGDGAGARIWRLQPGGDGKFGTSDDVRTSFSTAGLGQTDPEDVHYDAATGNLFFGSRKNTTVVETTLAGALVNSYDLSGTGMKSTSGITIAPTSTSSSQRSLYIADRGGDNDSNPNENDGKLFEYALGSFTPVNKPPTFDNPGPQTNFEGDEVSLQITATDPEGDTITYSVTGLPAGLTINASSGLVSGTIATGASAGTPYSVNLTSGDNHGATFTENFVWTVKDLVAPAAPTGFSTSSETTGLVLNWNDNTEPDIAGYNVRRSPTGLDNSFTTIAGLVTTSEYVDAGAPPGEVSYYRIRAVDRSGNESTPLAESAGRAKIGYLGSAKNNGRVTSLNIVKPAVVANGDLLLAVIGIRGTAAITAPSGWTKLGENQTTGSTPLKQAVFFKLAGAAEPGSYGFGVGSSSIPTTGMILAYRGAAAPVTIFGGQPNASSTSITAPSVTATAADSVHVGFFGNAISTTITPPAGMVEQDETTISSTSNKITIEAADDMVPAGSTGTRAATAAAASVNVGQAVVLKPLGPQPPTVTNPGPVQNFDGDAVSLPITATDAEGDPFTFSATGLPAGLSIGTTTGVVTGTVAAGAFVSSPYSVTVTATDATGSGSATFTWTIKDPNAPVAVDLTVAASSDDAEESPGGAVSPGGSDLELVTDGSAVQTVGVRFTGVSVPAGATITNAWIQFQADEASSEATSLTIKGQAADNAATFTTATNNVSSRPRTTAAAAWAPPAWTTVGESGAAQRTPSLTAILQEIVSRPGWASNNAVAFIFTGTGRRVAEPFDGGPIRPAIHIEYTVGPPPPPTNAAPVVTNPGPKQNLEGDVVSLPITATDADGDPITYEATGLPGGLSINTGTGVISGTVAAGAAASSPYTVTVTASDGTASGSTTFIWTITDGTTPPPSSTLDIVVAAGSDDAEESSAGAVDLTSSDLEIVQESTLQTVGVRFAGVNVPAGSTITAAWIQFQADEATSGATNLTVQAHAIDNAPTFSTAASNISSRPRTAAAATWVPAAWPTVGASGADQRTGDLKTVLQQIVDRTGWAPGNAIAFIITGSGKRVAEPFEGGPVRPTLHIEYSSGGTPTPTPTPNPSPTPTPTNQPPSVTNPGPQSSTEGQTVTLPISASDPESDPITYSATGLPGGLSINPGTGAITGTVASGAAASSPYTVIVTATATGGSGTATFTWTISTEPTPPPTPTTLNVVMTAPADDMEEAATGAIDAGSSDLELVAEGSLQTVGLRFTGVTVPAGATITAAWIQFQVDEVSSGACNLLVQAEAADNAAAFTTTAFNVSSRPRTTAGASWTPPDWPTVGVAAEAQRTSNLAAVLQEIVSRPGWGSGNAMAFIITGTGKRVAESHEGGPLDPTLHIEYTI